MVTRSTDEAIDLLKRTRRVWIDMARVIAREQCLAEGSTHSRNVLAMMEELGLLNDAKGAPDYWLGAVFRSPEFVETGDTYTYSDSTLVKQRNKQRNVHERTIKVWKLR